MMLLGTSLRPLPSVARTQVDGRLPCGLQPLRTCIVPSLQRTAVPPTLAPTARSLRTALAAARHVVFFMDSTEVYRLPLEPQQLLALKPGVLHKDSEVNTAFDMVNEHRVDKGYSPQITEGRAELLALIRSTLITAKRVPMEDRDHDTVVPSELLPACLALLADVGQNELVLELGTELLSSGNLNGYPATRSDVLLAMALAKCSMATAEFDANKDKVSGGCQHLEEALELLRPKGLAPVAPHLIQEIQEALCFMACQCILEQMSAPLDKEHSEERRHAIKSIRDKLRQASDPHGSSAASEVNTEFMSKLVPLLTCEELIHLQDWEAVARHTPAYKWVCPGLLERVVYGRILFAYEQCQPAYLQQALHLTKQLPASSELLVAQSICQLLLGNIRISTDLMTQSAAAPPRVGGGDLPVSTLWGTQALRYVEKNTPAGDDVVSGLCKYALVWLCKFAMPLFRDSPSISPDDPSEVKRLDDYFSNTRVEALITVYDEKAANNIGDSVQGVVDDIKQRVGRIQEVARTSLTAAGASTLRLPDMPPSSVLSDLPPLSDPTARRLLMPAAATAGLLALAIVFWPRNSSGAAVAAASDTRRGTGTATVASSRQTTTPSQSASSTLQTKTAEGILRQWQDIKTAALGEQHDVSRLSEVLAPPALSRMRDHVRECEREGLYMRIKNRGVKVRDIESGPRQSFTVTATLEEAAYLYQGTQLVDASGMRSYESHYQFVKDGDRWRISDWTVLDDRDV